jgi:hypothetical protein
MRKMSNGSLFPGIQAMGRSMASDENVPLTNLFTVNFESLTTVLSQSDASDITGFTLDLPLLEGKTKRFRVIPSAVMEATLQARFPMIRTFKLLSIETGQLDGRIGISPEGFMALLISTVEVLINKVNKKGQYFICSI